MKKVVSIQEVYKEEYNINVINSIKKKYPELRQLSKSITFAFNYGGGPSTVVNHFINYNKALELYNKYNSIYRKTKDYFESRYLYDRYKTRSHCIYNLAFDLKYFVDCKDLENNKVKRSVINSFCQSYNMLTLRALNEFMNEVDINNYTEDIIPINTIHDSLLFLVRDDENIINFTREKLLKAFSWQEDINIKNKQIKLSGDFIVY